MPSRHVNGCESHATVYALLDGARKHTQPNIHGRSCSHRNEFSRLSTATHSLHDAMTQQTQPPRSQQTASLLTERESKQMSSAVDSDLWEDSIAAMHVDAMEPSWDTSTLLPMPAANSRDGEAPMFRPSLPKLDCSNEQAQGYAAMIKQAMADMRKVGSEGGRLEGFTEQSWMNKCEALLAGQGDFTAAQPRQHAAGYEEYWNLRGPLRQQDSYSSRVQTKASFKIITEGLKPCFVKPQSQQQQAHPQYKQKLAAGVQLIRMARGPSKIQSTLSADSPQPAEFSNHTSVRKHADFVQQEGEKMLRTGALLAWPQGMAAPEVISPLGVVEQPKLRLIFDGRYINLWEKYESFSYEQLGDVAKWMQPGFYLWSTDFTSGYHYIPIHPDYWKYLGCRLPNGLLCCFTVLPIGLSSGCKVFSSTMNEVYRPIRQSGIIFSYLIDDEMGGASSLEEALFNLWIILRILVALGWKMGLPKLQLWPQLQGRFLGMIARSSVTLYPGAQPSMVFEVPEPKMQQLRKLITETLQREQVSTRQLASIAGKLIAMGPALELGRLYSRCLYEALQGKTHAWDELHQFDGAWRADLQWLHGVLPTINGRRMVKREQAVRLAGDAGEAGLSVYSLGPELPHNIVGTWTAQQRALIANEPKEFSSTLRELLALDYALDCISADAKLAEAFKHKHLVYEGDSQVMEACINKMGGNQRNYPIVKHIWETAFQLDIGLEMQWRPREESNQRLADSLEKQQDPGDWVVANDVLRTVYEHPAVGRRPFTLDAFASDTNSKVPHSFYSKWLCKGTQGVNAFGHPWAVIGQRRQFCWINGPFSEMGRILKKIREEKCDAAVLHPISSSYWTGMLGSLPVRARIPVTSAQITAGYRLPDSKKTLNFTKLEVSIILW